MPAVDAPETLRRVRERNLTRILRTVAQRGETRQADLPELTELATGAVSMMVNQLLEHDLLEERIHSAGSRGRPSRSLLISDRWAEIFAVSITRDGLVAEAQTLTGRTVGTWTEPMRVGEEPEETAARVAQLLTPALRQHGRPGGQCVVAVSIPGRPFDTLGSIELEWMQEPIRRLLDPLSAAGFGDVLLGNDGSFAAIGEVTSGRGRGLSQVVTLLLERGLGGSAIIDGDLVSGFQKPAGWGHIPLEAAGRRCPCGLRGCAEQYFSLDAMARELGEDAQLAELSTTAYTATLVERARGHDRRTLEVLADARERFEHLCDVLAGSFDPDLIVLTGHGLPLAPWLLSHRPAGVAGVPVDRGELGGRAPLVGALDAARRARFENPLFASDGGD